MSQPLSTTVNQNGRTYKSIFLAGFLAGTLDAVAAAIMYYVATGKHPEAVFKYIASGVFGEAAFAGGTAMAACGLLFHYIIAFAFTLFFFLLYTRLNILSKNIVVTGLLYGLFVWLVMNLVVVPLSKTPVSRFDIHRMLSGILVLMMMVGLPIALVIHQFYRDKVIYGGGEDITKSR